MAKNDLKQLECLVNEEYNRQNNYLELIASENFTSAKIQKLVGSVLTNKYAEGFPGNRYYGGCEVVDKIEQLAIDKAGELFHCKYANVQPHSGSSANLIVYGALLKPGDKILSLGLNEGGHLTHGSPVSQSGKLYTIVHYHLKKNGRIDYAKMAEIARKERPQLILAGFSSYPYIVDFQPFAEVAREIGAYFMVDMAHIAGLIATGLHPSPFPYADVVTSTTHKTLRGPRGGLILTDQEKIIQLVNKSTFPGHQGGPLEHVIAGKAQCFIEALEPKFKTYIKKVLTNTKACAQRLKQLGMSVSGTQTHLFIANTKTSFNLTGLEAQIKLEDIGITLNKNMLPDDTESPKNTSGIRIGMAALTTRGLTRVQAIEIAEIIYGYLKKNLSRDESLNRVQTIVKKLKKVPQFSHF